MEHIMMLNNRMTKYRALCVIFTFLKGFCKFLGFSSPLVFFMYFLDVNIFICLLIAIVVVALMRIVWVQFDAKSRIYKNVYEKIENQKEEILNESFK